MLLTEIGTLELDFLADIEIMLFIAVEKIEFLGGHIVIMLILEIETLELDI